MKYWRWLLAYASGLAEGSVMVWAGDHHWPPWPGVIWLILPMVFAAAAFLARRPVKQ